MQHSLVLGGEKHIPEPVHGYVDVQYSTAAPYISSCTGTWWAWGAVSYAVPCAQLRVGERPPATRVADVYIQLRTAGKRFVSEPAQGGTRAIVTSSLRRVTCAYYHTHKHIQNCSSRPILRRSSRDQVWRPPARYKDIRSLSLGCTFA
jgi:hypothetical protein